MRKALGLVSGLRRFTFMSYLPALFALWCVNMLAVASPGPAFVATVRVATRSSRGSALLHSLGLGMGVAVWASATMFGLLAVMQKVTWLYHTIQFAGGAYLVFIGIQAWRHARDEMQMSDGAGPSLGGWTAFRRGLGTNLANPKAMVFYASIFASLLNPAWPNWIFVAALVIVTLDEIVWFSLISLLLSTQHARASFRQAKRHIERAAGTLMLAFGGRLMWSSLLL